MSHFSFAEPFISDEKSGPTTVIIDNFVPTNHLGNCYASKNISEAETFLGAKDLCSNLLSDIQAN
jgi:hypothetical protein